ncbi:dihydrofolate reductase family protein [Actinomycetospora sp. CA-101289]|uniref:dihydrofolate reductase family protein n=1 Tax=Actinomycetospora sp. CA-101289 TaxID=3239893 RepID=UPI003D9544A7
MRRLVVCSIVSLDGFSAGPGGDVTALPFDDGFDLYCAERLRAADIVLTGRSSYELLRSYWPGVADDPNASDSEREVSRQHNAARQVVVSDSLTIGEDEPWSATTTVVRRADAHATVRELLAANEILVFGSGTVWNDLLTAGLVGELHLLVGPTLLGAGIPVFRGPPTPLRLLEARQLDGSSLVLHRYSA